jgi:hypothetical protein
MRQTPSQSLGGSLFQLLPQDVDGLTEVAKLDFSLI